jgi:hypothetical protein
MGVALLNHVDNPGPFRLVGLVAYDLVDINNLTQLELFSAFARQRQLEIAIDALADVLAPTFCIAPMISTIHQECVWRRPLISSTTSHSICC